MISTGREILEQLFSRRESTELKARFIRGAAGSFALKVVLAAATLVLNVLLSRVLGVSGYGAYSYAFAWVTLLGVPVILGMDQLLLREVATYQVQSEWGKLRGLLQHANRAVLVSSLAMASCALLVSWLLQDRIDTVTRITFWIALAHLPVIALTRIRQSVLQGLQYVFLSAVPENLIRPVLMIAVIGAGWWLFGRFSAPWAMAVGVFTNIVGLIIGAILLARLLPAQGREARPEFAGFQWVDSILPLMMFASVSVIYGQADILVLGALKDPGTVGYYAVADRSAELINFVAVAVSTALAPAVANIYARKDQERLQAAILRVVRVGLLLSLPVGLFLMLLGNWWLLIMYGAAFLKGRVALSILSAGQLLSAAAGPGGLVLLMTGYEKDASRGILASAILHIGLCGALIPKWGADGAAIAAATSNVTCNIILAAYVQRRLRIGPTILGQITL